MVAGATGEGAGQEVAAGAQAPPGKSKVAPSSRPYLKLAEAGYLAQVVFDLAYVVVLAVLFETVLAGGLLPTLASTAIAILLSVAWVQLGRKQGVSWFVAAGAIGWVSPVISLILWFEPAPASFGLGFVLSQVESVVSIIYFAAQLLAFYTAGKLFQVGLFKYAAYLLAIEFVASPVVAAVLLEATAMQHVAPIALTNLVYMVGLLFSAALSLTAAAGFHRVTRLFP